MALLTCDFFSDQLEVGTSMTVVLPQATASQIGVDASAEDPAAPPVLYLLHGLSDDHTSWLRYTSIERYATAAGLAVVMPAVHRSFYTDEAHGHRYWGFVSEELPRIVQSFFRVSDSPTDTFVAGLSMGGYGALKLALSHPERYAAAASLSGAVDVAAMITRPERAGLSTRIFGDEIAPHQDLYALLESVDVDEVPPLYVGCGTEEDALLPANVRLAERAAERGIDVTTDYRPGVHEWGLWDDVIRDVIAWLPLRDPVDPA